MKLALEDEDDLYPSKSRSNSSSQRNPSSKYETPMGEVEQSQAIDLPNFTNNEFLYV